MNCECKKHTASLIAPALRMLFTQRGCVVYIPEEKEIASNGLALLTVDGADVEEIYSALTAHKGQTYDAVVVPGVGAFAMGCCKQDADNVAAVLSQGAARQAVAPLKGRMENKISVVTGAAQGFGEGMSNYMAEQGSYIVIADLNEEKAKVQADHLNGLYGPGTAIAVKVDISDETAVEKMFRETVLTYGGLDVFIACAGISKSGNLETMTIELFERIAKVNYTSFFIGTRHASRILKLEKRFDPEFTSDVIQINSQSGIIGSVNNFAYSGSKFGSIGLVQCFAKELIPAGVKVNAICPGNYFDGPLWSDPVHGLFVHFLETGKCPGAKTVEDVRQYHLNSTPMGRGCTPKDVVQAVFYCIDQQFETGQAIPVSGGRCMLK